MLVPMSPRFPIVHNSTVNRFGFVSPVFDIKYIASCGFDQSCLLEKEMATHSSVLAGGAWWAAIYGVSQSWTRLKRLSSSSSLLAT